MTEFDGSDVRFPPQDSVSTLGLDFNDYKPYIILGSEPIDEERLVGMLKGGYYCAICGITDYDLCDGIGHEVVHGSSSSSGRA